MNKEENKETMICYLGTFNWNMEVLKTKSYEEVEKLYLSMNPPKGLLQEPTPLDKDLEEAVKLADAYLGSIERGLFWNTIKQGLELGQQYKMDASIERGLREVAQSTIDKIREFVAPIAGDWLISMGEESKRGLAQIILNILEEEVK